MYVRISGIILTFKQVDLEYSRLVEGLNRTKRIPKQGRLLWQTALGLDLQHQPFLVLQHMAFVLKLEHWVS